MLPTLVLALLLPVFLLATGARAEDPAIVTASPTNVGGNTASGSIGSSGADTCVNDQGSSAKPSQSDPGNSAKLNQGSCTAGNTGSGGSGGSAGSSGSGGASGAKAGSASSASWVSASRALGLKIVRVQPQTKLVGTTKRFAVLVTVRDLRGKTVRHAIVTVGRVPSSTSTISGQHAAYSNKAGQAKVSVPATSSMLGKRLLLKIVARTPRAKAMTLRSVWLPKVG